MGDGLWKNFYIELCPVDRGQIGPGEVLCWRTPGLAESFFLGDMRPCRRKPFFFFLAAGILNVTVAPWQYNSLFFFWQLPSHTVPLGIYGPVARWRLEKNAWPFFFFGSLANVLPSVCKRKKNKNKKKSCKKKVLLYKY